MHCLSAPISEDRNGVVLHNITITPHLNDFELSEGFNRCDEASFSMIFVYADAEKQTVSTAHAQQNVFHELRKKQKMLKPIRIILTRLILPLDVRVALHWMTFVR